MWVDPHTLDPSSSQNSGSRIVEALYLKVRHGESTQTFNFWMYGETKELRIGSGLRVGDDGISFNHHFLRECAERYRRKMPPPLRFLRASTPLTYMQAF
jgi:hypothetical protein